MKIEFFCPRWGSETINWNTFSSKVKSDGFDGVEVYPFGEKTEKKEMINRRHIHFQRRHW
ncbi:hypothetical protein [Sphingobacterium hungaricum]|uniref:hypothetical protein n=1 Tax=Sphingobacterium hungaricum TaxID=2082723 RepID=UPI0018CAFCA0|nr:hypothetical protein [Sphingobacterium hungaricum]